MAEAADVSQNSEVENALMEMLIDKYGGEVQPNIEDCRNVIQEWTQLMREAIAEGGKEFGEVLDETRTVGKENELRIVKRDIQEINQDLKELGEIHRIKEQEKNQLLEKIEALTIQIQIASQHEEELTGLLNQCKERFEANLSESLTDSDLSQSFGRTDESYTSSGGNDQSVLSQDSSGSPASSPIDSTGANTTIDIGTGMNMTTTVQGSPENYQQVSTIDSSAPGFETPRMVDAPFNLNQTATLSHKTPFIPKSRFGYTDPTVQNLNLPPGFFYEGESIKKTVILSSPERQSPLKVDIDVRPHPLTQTRSGEHFVCDISLNMQDTLAETPDKVHWYKAPPQTESVDRRPHGIFTPRGVFKRGHTAVRDLFGSDFESPDSPWGTGRKFHEIFTEEEYSPPISRDRDREPDTTLEWEIPQQQAPTQLNKTFTSQRDEATPPQLNETYRLEQDTRSPALNQTFTSSQSQMSAPGLNRALFSSKSPSPLNVTSTPKRRSPQLNRTLPVQRRSPQLNRTLPVQRRSPQLNRTLPVQRSQLNRTFSPKRRSPQLNRTFSPERRSPQLNRTFSPERRSPQLNRTFSPERRSPQLNRTLPVQRRSPQLNRTLPVQRRSPQLNRTIPVQRRSPQLNSTFTPPGRASPQLDRTLNSPSLSPGEQDLDQTWSFDMSPRPLDASSPQGPRRRFESPGEDGFNPVERPDLARRYPQLDRRLRSPSHSPGEQDMLNQTWSFNMSPRPQSPLSPQGPRRIFQSPGEDGFNPVERPDLARQFLFGEEFGEDFGEELELHDPRRRLGSPELERNHAPELFEEFYYPDEGLGNSIASDMFNDEEMPDLANAEQHFDIDRLRNQGNRRFQSP